MFNESAKKTLYLGPNTSFDEGNVLMMSQYCHVQIYHKDKPDKLVLIFYADYHLDVYQGKIKANININYLVRDFLSHNRQW